MAEEVREDSSSEPKGDPNPNRLMAKILDKVDGILFEHGLEFRHEEEDWENLTMELSALIFRFWDDKTGGDSSYNPDASSDDKPVVESEDESATLSASSEEAQSSSDGEEDKKPAQKKLKK